MRLIRRNTKLQWKRIVSMLLAVLMVLTSAPLTELVYANEIFHEQRLRMLGAGPVVSPEVNGNAVTFRYYAPDAKSVQLAGSMTDWGTKPVAMNKGEDGTWSITQTLATGVYFYKFIVDGNGVWIADPCNPYPLDGENSQVAVGFEHGPKIEGQSVTFRYYAPEAESVAVAGTMNNWQSGQNVMTKDASGIWSTTIELNDGCYLYKFVAKKAENEAWLTDCGNKHMLKNGNSVLVVGSNVTSPEINGNNVTFRYCDSEASSVKIPGDMTSWGDDAPAMQQDKDGVWYYTIEGLAPGTYTYKFRNESKQEPEWTADPQNLANPGDYESDSTFTIEGDETGGGEEVTPPTEPSENGPIVNGKQVTFCYKDENASAIYLSGDMNGWNPEGTLMVKGADGVWKITLTLEYGTYAYKFYDGVKKEWIIDPNNPNRVSDGYGGYNCKVIVPGLVGKSVACLRGGYY